MTREEEIIKVAELCASANTQIIGDWSEHFLGFIHGAEWADAHPHWISVDEELPPRFPLNPNESMNVITYGLHTMVNWYDYERGEWVRDSEITHWMPLPQAPHHIIDANKKVDRVIGTADHIKTALDVLNKKGDEK